MAEAARGPWEKYRSTMPAAPARSSSGPWERYAPMPDKAEPATESGSWRLPLQATAGINETLYDIAGAPVDAATWLTNKGVQGVNAIAGKDVLPEARGLPGSSAWLEKAFGSVGVPEPSKMPAETVPEKMARGAGQGVAGMVAPEAVIGALGRAGALTPKAMEYFGSLFGRSQGVGDVAKGAAIGAAGGAGAVRAEEAVPEPWKPLAGLAGGLGAGGVAALATELPAVVRAGGRAVADIAAPFTESGQRRLAAETLRDEATDPSAFLEALRTAPKELVPGSKPTSFQATGDLGIGGLERRVMTGDPTGSFMARRGEQAQARLRALDEARGSGDPVAVAEAARRARADAERSGTEAVDAATRRAQDATAALPQSPTERLLEVPKLFRAELDRIDALTREATDEATGAAAQATRGLGGEGVPEVYGADLRGAILARRAEAKAREDALWKAVDPDGKLALDVSPVRDTARAVMKEMPKSGKPMEGEERAAFGVAASYRPVMPFSELTALRSRVSTAMRKELKDNGRTPAYGRMTRLRGAIEGAIETAMERRAVAEARAVDAGEIPLEDATLERWRQNWGQDAGTAEGELGQAVPAVSGGASSGRSASGGAGVGATSETRGGLYDAAGDPGIPGSEPLIPNVDEAAARRLKAASEATRERKATFDEGAVGRATRSAGMSGVFRASDASVPRILFRSGPAGAEDVGAFRRAVGDDPAALQRLSDYAASAIRRAAERDDGTLDPRKVGVWIAAHRDAIRSFPGLFGKVQRAVRLSNEAADAAKAAAITRSPYESGPLGTFVRLASGETDLDGPALAARVWVTLTRLRDDPFAFREARAILGQDRLNEVTSEAAALAARRAAERPDGTIDPQKFEAWRKANADMLRRLPEVDSKFSDAAAATRAIDDAVAARKAAIEEAEGGAAGRLLGAQDPEDVSRIVGQALGGTNSVGEMRRLAARVASDPAAREGLRRAVADHIARRFITTTEAATSGDPLIAAASFQKFVRDNETALRTVLTSDQVKTLKAIADDLFRANRSITGVKIPGSPGTAQDVTAQFRAKGRSILSEIVGEVVAAGAGGAAAGLPGALAGSLGARVLSGLRRNRMESVDAIVREALLNPELASRLLADLPPRPDTGTALSLANQLRRLSVVTGVTSADRER